MGSQRVGHDWVTFTFTGHLCGPQNCPATWLSLSCIDWCSLHGPLKEHPQPHHNSPAAAAAAKSLQSCPTPCDPIDGSSPGSPVPGILQARTLEWVAISFSNAWKWKVKVKSLSHVRLLVTPVRLLVTPWTAAYQASSFMGFSRQEYWSGVPLPSLTTVLLCFKSQPLSSCHYPADPHLCH